jgi:hypothetical protein
MQAKIQRLAELIHEQTIERYHTETIKHYPENAKYPWLWENPSKVTVIPGKKYTKIDVGASGKYMVDSEGNIFGIKAYGVIHRGHQYGTLDTIDSWYWGDYTAVHKSQIRHVKLSA